MKYLIISLLLISCGENTTFNYNYDDSTLIDRLDKLEAKNETLQSIVDTNTERIKLIDSLENDLKGVNNILDDLKLDVINLDIKDDNFVIELQLLQSKINNVSQILEKTTEVIDLCQVGGEILIRTNDDRLISFFESGNKRYLSVLQDGAYKTTDGENCHFTISNNQVI